MTAGITNPPAIAGEEPPPWKPGGTINVALVINEGLTVGGAMANAIMTATEAKTYTLLRLGYNATGTTSDGIGGVFAFEGEVEWAGTATASMSIGRAVRKALEESLRRWERTRRK